MDKYEEAEEFLCRKEVEGFAMNRFDDKEGVIEIDRISIDTFKLWWD